MMFCVSSLIIRLLTTYKTLDFSPNLTFFDRFGEKSEKYADNQFVIIVKKP